MISKLSSFAALAVLAAVSSPVLAAKPVTQLTDLSCGAGDFTASGLTYVSCSGYWNQNLNNGSDASFVAAQLAELGLQGANGSWAEKIEGLSNGNAVNFTADPTPGTGISTFWIGVHRGAGGTQGTQGTAFYQFTGTASVDALTYNLTGFSNAALYGVAAVQAPIPEPETYAMMLAGLAAVGFVARRRRQA